MTIQEMATIMHHRLPVKLFVLNNGGYLTIKQTQELGFEGRIMGSTEESGISFPDFMKIAEAHRFKGGSPRIPSGSEEDISRTS